MRIAVFYNLLFGGAKRVVFEHVRGLKKLGYKVDIYTTDAESDFFNFHKISDNVFQYPFKLPKYPIPVVGKIISDYKNFFILKELHKKIASDIDTKDYDCVLVHPDRLTQAPFLLQFLQTPSFYYCEEPLRIAYEYALRFKEDVSHINKLYEVVTRQYRKQIDRINTQAASVCIASCFHIRERMIESYEVYPKVNYPGIDQNLFRPKKIEKDNEILFVGAKNLVTDGYDLVENAMKRIPAKKRPKVHVLSWVKENNQRLTEEELVGIYNRSTITLCLSRFETFGLVPLESMACGTPVIATNVSGHRETVIDNKTGFLVDFNPNEISEKIQLLLNNSRLISNMSREGRKHILEKWTWDRQISRLDEILKTNEI